MDSLIQHRFVEALAALPVSVTLILAVFLVWVVYYNVTAEKPIPGLPVVSYKEKGFTLSMLAFNSWMRNARLIIDKGLRECNGPFQVLTGSGYKIVIPNRYANELKSHPDLNFPEAFVKDFFIEYPGFDGHKQGCQDGVTMQEVVRIKLTQSLGLVTDDLVDEANESLRDRLGAPEDWETREIKEDMVHIVARLSSRVFLGKDLCRDEEWLRISKSYTITSFTAANELRMVWAPLRPIAHWFMPICVKLRGQVRDAREIVEPEILKRRIRAENTLRAGGRSDKVADAIGWIVECARGRKMDYTAAQLALSMAAIHTTSETTVNALVQLCEAPELVKQLREEVVQVLSEDGWDKRALYKMRRLDSFLKETQRLYGLSMTSMHRMVMKDITLSDGTVLPAGHQIMITNERIRDDKYFPDGNRYDPERFLNLRQQPGEENKHQFVSPSSEHMGFGFGEHACPGRFFASNEIKIALCFFLLRYDFRYPPSQPQRPKDLHLETAMIIHPSLRIQVRKRQPEIDLDNPRRV